MGRGAVGIDGGEGVGIDHALDHFFAAALARGQHRRCEPHARTRQPQVRQVRQDAQAHRAARELLDQRRHRLGHGVDGVGAHRVAHVDDQVHHHHRAARRVAEHMHLDVAAAAAQADQHLVAAVRHGQDFFTRTQQRQPRTVGVGDADHLHLRAHQRPGARGLEATAFARQLGHEGGGGDHRGFFHRHRYEVVATVHGEVAGHAQRQLEGADHVLDHAVGALHAQRAGLREQRHLVVGERGGLCDVGQALGGRECAEIGNAGIGGHRCVSLRKVNSGAGNLGRLYRPRKAQFGGTVRTVVRRHASLCHSPSP
ncbi:hypothetical protein D9M68_643560 [compost metagenome]